MSQVKVKRNYLACCVGVITMLGLSGATILLLPIFILNEYLPMEYTQALIIILMGIEAFLGSLLAGYLAADDVPLTLFLPFGVYGVLLLLASIFIFDGLTLRTLYSITSGAVGYLAAWLLVKKGKKSHVKRKKRRGCR